MPNQHRSENGSRRAITTWTIAVVLLMCLPGSVGAGDGFTSPLIIPAAEFEASGVWDYGTLDRFSDSHGYIYAVSDELTCVMAPVYLPNGAEITRFEAAVSDLVAYNPDSSSTCPRFYDDVEVELISNHMDDNIGAQDTQVVIHASVSSNQNNGQTHVVADTSIDTPFVNNLQQIYWVRVYVCGLFQGFQGVRIHYEE